jgi:hypothetical protein
MAGAADRIGSLEKGKIANLVVTEGDLFDGGRVRHVFIDGRPIEVVDAPAQTGIRGGTRWIEIERVPSSRFRVRGSAFRFRFMTVNPR